MSSNATLGKRAEVGSRPNAGIASPAIYSVRSNSVGISWCSSQQTHFDRIRSHRKACIHDQTLSNSKSGTRLSRVQFRRQWCQQFSALQKYAFTKAADNSLFSGSLCVNCCVHYQIYELTSNKRLSEQFEPICSWFMAYELRCISSERHSAGRRVPPVVHKQYLLLQVQCFF